MSAQINFYAGNNQIQNLGGSGLGMYGSNFGFSIPVNTWQQSTYVTDSTGTLEGVACWNNQYGGTSSTVIIGQSGSGIALTSLPNWQTTLNIQFLNSSPVMAQNASFCIYDGFNTANPPSGVLVYCAEIIHPGLIQNNTGSGSAVWFSTSGLATLPLSSGPGVSGQFVNGPNTISSEHDWYCSVTVSPLTTGSKAFAGLMSLEYL